MSVRQLLRIPWYAAHRSLRWLIAIVLALSVAGAVAIDLLSADPAHWKISLLALVLGQGTLWMLFLPNTLRLAILARQFCVPRAQQQVVGSLWVYAALSVIVPAAWLAARGAPVLPVTIVLALCACGGMAWAVLPPYLGIFISTLPYLLNTVHSRLKLADMADPQMVGLMALLALALLWTTVRGTRRLLHGDIGPTQNWSSPMVLRMNAPLASTALGTLENWRLRQVPGWLRALPDMAGVRPSRPDKVLRMALGGAYLPQTWRSHARRLLMVIAVLALLLCIALLPLLAFGRGLNEMVETAREVLHGALLGPAIAMAVVAGTTITARSVAFLDNRWQRANAELPLLALLPGLGDAARRRCVLVRVALRLPLLGHATVALVLSAASLLWPEYVGELGFLLLAQLGSAAVTSALLLGFLGGRPLDLWRSVLLHGVCFTLTLLSLCLPLAWNSYHTDWAHALLSPLLLAWLLLIVAMLWLARRGWLALQQLPHPFLAR
jgi:hypothetical protein